MVERVYYKGVPSFYCILIFINDKVGILTENNQFKINYFFRKNGALVSLIINWEDHDLII